MNVLPAWYRESQNGNKNRSRLEKTSTLLLNTFFLFCSACVSPSLPPSLRPIKSAIKPSTWLQAALLLLALSASNHTEGLDIIFLSKCIQCRTWYFLKK